MKIETLEVPRTEIRDEHESPVELIAVPDVGADERWVWHRHWEVLPGYRRVAIDTQRPALLHEWVPAIDRALPRTGEPVVVVGHGLGAIALAWWASLMWRTPNRRRPRLIGALLVSPPDVDDVDGNPGLRDFRPLPQGRLPFRSILVASRNDPTARFDRAAEMAKIWGSELVDSGEQGHHDGRSRLGEWVSGLSLLARLMDREPGRLVAEFGLRTVLR